MSAFSGSALSLRDRLRKPVPPAAAVLWPLALAFFADLVLRSYSATRVIVDFGILHDGAVRLVHGQSVYSDPFFLLPPSGLFLVAPFGLLSAHTAFLIWNTLSILAAVIGVACAVRFAGLSIRGPVGAALLLVLSLSESLTTTLLLGNLNNCVLLALGSGYLLAERRGRPRLAGVLLGLSLAVKPVFVLVLLLPLLQRRWRTVGWAIAIPAVLNVAGFLLTPHRGDFLSIAVTNLLSARPGTNSSLWAMGVYWGVPGPTVAVLRVLIVLLALAGVWRLRSLPDRLCGLAVGYGLVLIATFLNFSLSEGYYSMLLAPLLVTAVRAGSPMRNPVAWVGVYFFLALNVWTAPQLPGLSARLATSRWTLGWLLLFAVLVVWALRRRPVDEPAHVPVLDTLSLDPPAGWESPVGR